MGIPLRFLNAHFTLETYLPAGHETQTWHTRIGLLYLLYSYFAYLAGHDWPGGLDPDDGGRTGEVVEVEAGPGTTSKDLGPCARGSNRRRNVGRHQPLP